MSTQTSPTPPSTPAPLPPPHRTLYDLLLAGTHDSGSYRISHSLISRQGPRPLAFRPAGALLRGVYDAFSRTQRLSVLEQLKAGARFLDLRISKVRGDEERFWIIHGMNVGVLLEEALEGINEFHRGNEGRKETVVCGCTVSEVTKEEGRELVALIKRALKHSLYEGDAAGLRKIAYGDLPHTVIAGVPGLAGEDMGTAWGVDRWINTYSVKRKKERMHGQLVGEGVEAGRRPEKRCERDTMYVLGWTVTPQWYDIVGRIATVGLARKPLRKKAALLNAEAEMFLSEHKKEIEERVNVIFFDFFTEREGKLVRELARELSLDAVQE